jgi:choline kinase
VGISKISKELYKEMLKQYRKFNSEIYDFRSGDYFFESGKPSKYDYENAIFDAAKNRKIGYLKIENLVWGEIDDKKHLERIQNIVIPKLEKNSEEKVII